MHSEYREQPDENTVSQRPASEQHLGRRVSSLAQSDRYTHDHEQ